jgi:hypothetical protein
MPAYSVVYSSFSLHLPIPSNAIEQGIANFKDYFDRRDNRRLFVAGEFIPPASFVRIAFSGLVYLAVPGDILTQAIGFSPQAISIHKTGMVDFSTSIYDGLHSPIDYVPGTIYYLGAGGTMTSAPGGSPYTAQRVGYAISTGSLLVKIERSALYP